jgi:seryl-tRNA synthetase
MLDIVYIRNNPQEVSEKLARRGFDIDFTEFLEADAKRRAMMHENEELKAERNRKSAEIPMIKKEGGDISQWTESLRQLSDRIKENDIMVNKMTEEQQEFLRGIPNIPADDIPAGGKENNEIVSVWGEPMPVDVAVKNHVDLVESTGMIDYERGVKLSGSGYWIYRGAGAVLEWALLNYFVYDHLNDGYEMMLPPHILNYSCGYVGGQFPKFEDDVFQLRGGGDEFQFLLPTAETALTNIHADEILSEEKLPKKYFAYTPCYRKEAGSYRAEERGMIPVTSSIKWRCSSIRAPKIPKKRSRNWCEKPLDSSKGWDLCIASAVWRRETALRECARRMTLKSGFPACKSTRKSVPSRLRAIIRQEEAIFDTGERTRARLTSVTH